MPIIKSAKKRVKTANKAAIRNSKTKRSLKSALKNFHTAIKSGNKNINKNQSQVQSAIDKASKKNVIHKNKANRLKKVVSQLSEIDFQSKKSAINLDNAMETYFLELSVTLS